jgi:uncharacterized surface anchored protein
VLYIDENNNNTQEANEPTLTNITLIIRNAAGKQIAEITTDLQGKYTLTNVAPGEYTITIASGLPAQYAYLQNRTKTVKVLGEQLTQTPFSLENPPPTQAQPYELALTGPNAPILPLTGLALILLAVGIQTLTRARNRKTSNRRK